jgi:hypothetical protein
VRTTFGRAFARQYDLGRAGDAVPLSLFKEVDYRTVGVDDAVSIVSVKGVRNRFPRNEITESCFGS